MTLDEKEVHALADRLHDPGPATLSDAERTLLVGALAALLASQEIVSRQARLLASFDEDFSTIERAASSAVGQAVALASARQPDEGFRYSDAAAARERLMIEVREAESGRAVLSAILRFALALAGPVR